MSFFSPPYCLIRPFLFTQDPEQAHDQTIHLLDRLQRSPLKGLLRRPVVHDPVTLAGLPFRNRVGLAAGLDKNAQCIDAFAAMGFGFIEAGTVTPRAQGGNPKPRMFRLPKANAIINRMGFNNEGLDVFVNNIKRSSLRSHNPHGVLLGLNIGKNASTPIEQALDDYLLGLAGVYPFADYVTVNISSPNTKNLRDLQGEETLLQLLTALNHKRSELTAQYAVKRPIFVKIAPDLTGDQIKVIADILIQTNMDGVIATNTTLARDAVKGLPHAEEAGGLSGAPLKEASKVVIKILREHIGKDFPIIGVGGVLSGQDALEKIQAGADVVQLYTGLIYQGPALVSEVAQALKG